MICHGNMIKARYRGRRYWYCTECGKLQRLDYITGKLIVIWQGKRLRRRVVG